MAPYLMGPLTGGPIATMPHARRDLDAKGFFDKLDRALHIKEHWAGFEKCYIREQTKCRSVLSLLNNCVSETDNPL